MTSSDSPVEIVWQAPPKRKPRTMYDQALVELKERRGSWARLRTFDATTGSAYSARQSLLRAFGDDEYWQVVVLPLEDDPSRHGLFARYRTDDQLKEVGRS